MGPRRIVTRPPDAANRNSESRGWTGELQMLRLLPTAAAIARRYTQLEELDDQLVEVALVGLMRAVDTFHGADEEQFEHYAEVAIDNELRDFIQDCSEAREDQIFAREIAAASATKRIEQALVRKHDVRALALSLGLNSDELAGGLVSAVLRHPEVLAART